MAKTTQPRLSAPSASHIEAVACLTCFERAETDLNGARVRMDAAVAKRNTGPSPELDLAVKQMQDFRERHTMVLRGHCYCKETKTQP